MVSLMALPHYKHIYGPVHSWRMGMSLGIDPLSADRKYCSFDCTYCQLGRMKDVSLERRVFVPVEDILQEISTLPLIPIDYLTFSGNGEPTLAANLGDMVRELKKARQEKIAVISNASTISRADVQQDLMPCDLVLLKLDAAQERTFSLVSHPAGGLTLGSIVSGIRAFRKVFKGRLALQMMFVEDNKKEAGAMARLARDIAPDEVQLNTPLRPGGTKPLDEAEMFRIKGLFLAEGLDVRSVYEQEKQGYEPFDAGATVKRHGRYKV
jgi:wyosine [tRNA(Phe)-imidazoG37] synthetase (radical SAM superfamily)